ncbi:MAG: ABC transporter substrate-binding protein [Deltaproteobacteria bacterium]|nr:ABC transporter substrate-binding protein [Deltaproteobacteria bacterium]
MVVAHAALAADVIVVESPGSRLYQEAVAGFAEVYEQPHPRLDMEGEHESDALIDKLRRAKPRVILAVGLPASRLLVDRIRDVPIVFCMANNPKGNKLKTGNTTGVFLEPAPGSQLRAFKRLAPSLKRLGLIYDPKRSGRFVKAARLEARRLEIELMEKTVNGSSEAPAALASIPSDCDGLWLLRDATVMTRSFFERTVLLQHSQKMLVLAYSDQFVAKGALCAFSSSYREQGRIAAGLVLKILSGASPAVLPIQTPRGHLSINLRAARMAGLQVPKELLDDAEVMKMDR